MRSIMLGAAVMLIAGCGEDTSATNTPLAAPATLAPGQYEITSTVTSFRSTDGNTPVVQAKEGAAAKSSACIGPDGTPPPELFAAKGDTCTSGNAYVRSGRINLTLDCTRKGTPGKIMSEINGSFTADALKGSMSTTSFIQGPGDYELRQDFTGRRVGECKAQPA